MLGEDCLMSDGKVFHRLMCRGADCLMSGGKLFHKLMCLEGD